MTVKQAREIVNDWMLGRNSTGAQCEIVDHDPATKTMRVKINGEPFKISIEVEDAGVAQ